MNEPVPRAMHKKALSIWDLPASLLTQPHRFRTRTPKRRGKERSHQAAILAFVYRNRFATASQIERRFADTLKSDRTARRHLAEMQEGLGLLDLVPTPSPLWPKVYSVSWQGMRKLIIAFQKKQPSWKPPVNDRRRIGFSVHHVYHELACTEFLLQVSQAAKGMGIDLLEMQRRSLVKNEAFLLPIGSGGRLVPDGMFLLRTPQGMICSFLEIDTGSMSLNSVAKKIHRYAGWGDFDRGRNFVTNLYKKHGATNSRANFRVAVIFGDGQLSDSSSRLLRLARIADRLPAAVRRSFWLTTTSAVRDAKNILTSEVWLRPAECIMRDQTSYSFLHP